MSIIVIDEDDDHDEGYRICDLARDTRRFVVSGGVGDHVFDLMVETEEEAKRLAEEKWPGCLFMLTTLGTLIPERPDDVPDLVVIAVGVSDDDNEVATVGYIMGEVHGPWCVPFSQELWAGADHNLPKHDHVRATRRARTATAPPS